MTRINGMNGQCRMTSKREGGLLEEALTRSVIGAFYDVHKELGFGFREYLYALALERELVAKGHRVDREVAVMVYYRGEPLAWQTLDMIVDERLVLETKATERLDPRASRQLFSYLCATNLEVGLLLHFGREPKFYRVICENRVKRHRAGARD
ncbi:MAG TPA: GxxExxY protein [Gemmatimonadaceae bacterium]|nr:GxxExxY protein [Gemmatimonadaceae bacterium]